MKILKIGLVTEGKTDQIVFRRLLGQELRASIPDIEVTFIDLQPSPDATSGNQNGGWELVYKWCLNNKPASRRSQYFGDGLFADDMNALQCDVIIVHLDADICDRISDKSSVSFDIKKSNDVTYKGEYIRDTIVSWLWPKGTTADDLHIPAPAVAHTETWLLAGLDLVDDIENIGNCELSLARAFLARTGRTIPPTMKKLQKNSRRYEKIAALCAGNILQIRTQCTFYASLRETTIRVSRDILADR